MKVYKVLHVFGSLDLGGAESRTMEIYRRIDKKELQFDFVTHTQEKGFYEDEIIGMGGVIHRLPRFNGLNYFKYRNAWKKILLDFPFDAIHGHQTTTGFIYLKIAKKFNITKRIAHARNSKKDSIFKYFLAKLARFYANELVAVSKNSAISEFGKKNLYRTKIIPNGFDYNRFKYNLINRKEIRNNYLITDNQKVFLHVGRLHPQKNHQFLLTVFHEILKIDAKSILFIVGKGKLKNKIQSLINRYKMHKNIVMIDEFKEIQKFYSAADCLIFPSKYEGLPGVLIEAQINSLNAIISDKITKEVQISTRLKWLHLDDSPKKWAEISYINAIRLNEEDLSNRFDISTKVYDEFINLY